ITSTGFPWRGTTRRVTTLPGGTLVVSNPMTFGPSAAAAGSATSLTPVGFCETGWPATEATRSAGAPEMKTEPGVSRTNAGCEVPWTARAAASIRIRPGEPPDALDPPLCPQDWRRLLLALMHPPLAYRRPLPSTRVAIRRIAPPEPPAPWPPAPAPASPPPSPPFASMVPVTESVPEAAIRIAPPPPPPPDPAWLEPPRPPPPPDPPISGWSRSEPYASPLGP